MANVAFGVRQTANGVGTTDTDIRHMLAQKWLNKGVVGGLQVSGGSTMAYNVSAGMAICSRGASDGFTEAYWSGGATPTVEANASSNPRIDVVWITAHDMSQGDADNLVTLGVTQGTPAATPTAPTIPTYATPLAQMVMPAGATTTTNAYQDASVDYAIPYGASLGVLLDKTDTSNAEIGSAYNAASGTINLPTDRLVAIKMTLTCSAVNGPWDGGAGSVYVKVLVDGDVKRAFEMRTWPTFAGSQYFEDCEQVAAGTHVVAVNIANGVSGNRRYYSAGGWAGQHVQVVDAGVVR